MIDIEKNYQIAKRLVGDLNKDLVHHCYLKIQGKKNIKHPNSYFYRVMLSELRKDSVFFKQFMLQNRPLDDLKQDKYQTPSSHQLNDILDILEEEGYTEEVKLFKLSKEITIKEISKKTNINRKTLTKICNFVKTKVREKWDYTY